MAEKIVYEAELDTSNLKKGFDDMSKASKKFDDNVDSAGRSIKGLGPVADGVKSKFGSLGSVIKQGFGLGIGIKLFDTFSQKLMENEKIAKLFQAAMNVLTGVINGVVEVIAPAIDWMSKLFRDPKGWWEDLIGSLQKGGQWIKTNLIDLVLNKFLEWSNNAKISILELRKAWNEFTGDTEEAEKIQKTIDDLNKQNIELAKANAEKVNNIKEVVKDVIVFAENAAKTIKKNVDKILDNQDFLLNYERNLARLQRKLQEISTQAEIDAEKQRQVRDDEFKSIDERISANEKLAEVLKKAKEDELKAQADIIAHMVANSAIIGKREENEKAIAEERIKLKEIENKYAGQESEQLTNVNGLLREKISITKTMTDAELEAYTIREQASIDELVRETDKINAQILLEDMLFQKKRDNLNASLELEKEGTSAYAEIKAQQLTLEVEHNAKVQANAKSLNKALSDENASRLDAMKQLFTGIGSLVKENSKTAVAMQIGNAIIDTYVAANKALASAPPPFNFIAMAGVIAGGIANIKKIYQQSQKMGVDTGGDSAVSNATAPIMSGPSIGIVGGQINSGNQLANAVNGAMSKPQRNYVVGSDVSTVQGLDRKISQNATLGG